MNPLLTIVIPVYNRERLIIRTLDSIAAAQKVPVSLILVDNNSSDCTRAVCDEWAALHRSASFHIDVLEEQRTGAPAARNWGLQHVDTPYVYFFDSDDLFSTAFLSDVQSLLGVQSPVCESDLVFVPVRMRRGNRLQPRDYERSSKPSVQIVTSMFSTHSMVFRTQWLRSIGGWDERLSIWQDWELGVRALLHCPHLLWATEKSYHEVLLHDDSITGASASARWTSVLEAMKVVCQEVKDASLISEDERRRCLRALYFRAHIHAGLLSREGCAQGASSFSVWAQEIMSSSSLAQMLYGRFLRGYTSKGGRGAWRLARWCLF